MKRKDKIIKEGRARVGNDLSDKELESNELFFQGKRVLIHFVGNLAAAHLNICGSKSCYR